jgi:hypothetical protein
MEKKMTTYRGLYSRACECDDTISFYRYVLIGNCYQIPLAIWPHDPLGESGSDLLEVIDRNQDEYGAYEDV